MVERRHLLVVEDLGLIEQLAPALTRAGWLVQACTSAREAIYVTKHKALDALLVAVTLPDERGDVIFYRLAALQPHLRTRTALLTHTDHDWAVAQTTHRVALHLPVTPDQIVRTVNAFYDIPTAL